MHYLMQINGTFQTVPRTINCLSQDTYYLLLSNLRTNLYKVYIYKNKYILSAFLINLTFKERKVENSPAASLLFCSNLDLEYIVVFLQNIVVQTPSLKKPEGVEVSPLGNFSYSRFFQNGRQ